MTQLPQAVLDRFATSYAVVCAFITDPEGRVLVVKPTYRPEWQFVGGMIDRGESPHEACAREVKEEIGIDLPVGDLLVLDYVPDHGFDSAPMTVYIFDCGIVQDPAGIRLQADELADFACLPVDEAAARFHSTNSARVERAAEARRTGRTSYVPQSGPAPR
ncbi:NUDIX domain-containing protein [Glycomyces algeriensis]|uniref:NUDIX hydrolase n=1 Tax=Glycomyces algeriensis TaxID=256037 RepID=A0A9W6GDW7_9ACTN|nr:NUDIX hydrolase [Glycomyces algeriensis]MDA1366466.1 NUDIX hydrolase [Glycomyces algeriensis]MDR7352125.1 8-oxo-dGTP pyrophosphatase MutT (NUDIX family) [Glycomyces algeriensis]GLI44858.1 NUDIX hydrolase [Glycomyces algeriensis]